jgi:carboxyl-terminal processing protease
MVRTLDPFSQFMEPEAHREIKAETEGEFGGIGVRLTMKDDWLTVLTPLPGTPAYRAGMLPNDRIVEIDGESTKDLQVADAMEKLRGAPGTRVRIAVMRWRESSNSASSETRNASDEEGDSGAEEDGLRKEFELSRESIKIESVQHRMLESHVGYLRIVEFSARTAQDFRDAMSDLSKEGLAGLVLDLRFNPGGLLTSAVDVAAGFLGGNKLIVYTQGRRPDSHQEFRGGPQAPYPDLPLVVLVNGASASGAEIVAGALQDHRRAVLMGTRTFGKASVQSVIPLPDNSGLRLTIAHYFTPNGRMIHRDEKKKTGGIAPDIEVPIPRGTEEKLFSQWEMIYEPGKKPRSASRKDDTVRDEALERAVTLIKARDVLGRLRGKGN